LSRCSFFVRTIGIALADFVGSEVLCSKWPIQFTVVDLRAGHCGRRVEQVKRDKIKASGACLLAFVVSVAV
jgi:hypothetical protein